MSKPALISEKAKRLRDIAQKRRKGIPRRIEELGQLNDEFVRLQALPCVDKDGYLRLAKLYAGRGMVATACGILREACLSEDILLEDML